MTNRQKAFEAITVGLLTEKRLPSYEKLRESVRENIGRFSFTIRRGDHG